MAGQILRETGTEPHQNSNIKSEAVVSQNNIRKFHFYFLPQQGREAPVIARNWRRVTKLRALTLRGATSGCNCFGKAYLQNTGANLFSILNKLLTSHGRGGKYAERIGMEDALELSD